MTDDTRIQAVLDCERRRAAALVQADLPALDALFADDLTYAHSSGTVDTKASFLQQFQRGRWRYESVTTDEVDVRLYGPAAVLTGTGEIRGFMKDKPTGFRYRFTLVYRETDGRWQLVALQNTRLPEPAPA